jgi:ABC-type Zn uptake system ZnuABC Zn-binding protein ZnuA
MTFLQRCKPAFFIFSILIFFNQKSYSNQNFLVVTTIPYLADLANNVTCGNAKILIHSIVKPGTDPHTFAISLSDRMQIEQSQMVFKIGNGFESWIDKIPKKEKQTWIDVTDTGNRDPHIWQSPSLTKRAVQKMAQGFINAKILTKEQIEVCTQSYLTKIDQTVENLKTEVQSLPKKNRILATNHDSLFYFAQEFGFKLVSILGTNDEAQPTPQQIRQMIESVKKYHAKVLFLESTGNMKNLESISRETGVKIGGQLFGDSLGPQGSGAETTLGMWKKNMATIIKAIK